jgi:secondary thiamine-phosphate synthase enzyme
MRLVQHSGVDEGLCNIFIRHTSASLMICENADPAVLRDMERFMQRLVPDNDPIFEHDQEGPDDMPAHVRSVLTRSDLTVPVQHGQLELGTWQGLYLWEHRLQGHDRWVRISVLGG